MSRILRGGVIGAGVFGGHHARQYARMPGVALSAVLDPHTDRAVALAVPLGGRAFADLDAFLEEVDVVTVASPAGLHGQQALAAIAAGKPVYVEKPIAISVDEAQAIHEAARKTGVVVACGHQERALFQAIGLFDIPEQPLRLEAVRHGTLSERNLDVSVVLDLMIHDLDLALALTEAKPVSVEGEGAFNGNESWDVARAEATFDDGFTATFDVSRCAPERRRTMRVAYPSGEVAIDFLARTFRNTTRWTLNPDFADTPAAKDTLAVSLGSFLAAVRGEAPAPLVGAGDAARALDLALGVEQALRRS
jgi:predicted dehydrogenase